MPDPISCNMCTCVDGTIDGCDTAECPIYAIEPCGASEPLDFGHERVAIDAGFLSVEVEYSGSCELHEFSLCYEPIVGSGNGAETRLHLTHHDPGAACDDVVQTSLVFDLYPITENEGVGEVFVQLGPHRLLYIAP